MSSNKIIDLVGLLLNEIADEKHKNELRQNIDNGNIDGLVKCLKRQRKLENQRVRNKKCYYKKKEQPTSLDEVIQFN
jgi:hypothetical protein